MLFIVMYKKMHITCGDTKALSIFLFNCLFSTFCFYYSIILTDQLDYLAYLHTNLIEHSCIRKLMFHFVFLHNLRNMLRLQTNLTKKDKVECCSLLPLCELLNHYFLIKIYLLRKNCTITKTRIKYLELHCIIQKLN